MLKNITNRNNTHKVVTWKLPMILLQHSFVKSVLTIPAHFIELEYIP